MEYYEHNPVTSCFPQKIVVMRFTLDPAKDISEEAFKTDCLAEFVADHFSNFSRNNFLLDRAREPDSSNG